MVWEESRRLRSATTTTSTSSPAVQGGNSECAGMRLQLRLPGRRARYHPGGSRLRTLAPVPHCPVSVRQGQPGRSQDARTEAEARLRELVRSAREQLSLGAAASQEGLEPRWRIPASEDLPPAPLWLLPKPPPRRP
ncbi:Hypothetical predicted protein [Podarcis lilfordi]|uniref:Uncharacterized protein n=1 Tax=Podarcis lilfordi TaxID=74358 RepID=A0AA35L5A9_9SAUR|nr:Hypothetical predicted protein [Podarcis lilfordi]